MKLGHSKILDFGITDPNVELSIQVPEGSIAIDGVIETDGVYIWFETTDLEDIPLIEHKYIVQRVGYSIRENYIFFKLLSSIVEDDDGHQRIVYFPIYEHVNNRKRSSVIPLVT